MCFLLKPSLYRSKSHDESTSGVDKSNSAATSRTEERRLDLESRRDERGSHESDRRTTTRSGESTRRTRQPRVKQKDDDSIWGVDETNSVAARRIGAIHDETTSEVDATNLVDNEANGSNGSTTRNTNFVPDLTS